MNTLVNISCTTKQYIYLYIDLLNVEEIKKAISSNLSLKNGKWENIEKSELHRLKNNSVYPFTIKSKKPTKELTKRINKYFGLAITEDVTKELIKSKKKEMILAEVNLKNNQDYKELSSLQKNTTKKVTSFIASEQHMLDYIFTNLNTYKDMLTFTKLFKWDKL